MEVCTVLPSASRKVCLLPPTMDTSGSCAASFLKVIVVVPVAMSSR